MTGDHKPEDIQLHLSAENECDECGGLGWVWLQDPELGQIITKCNMCWVREQIELEKGVD